MRAVSCIAIVLLVGAAGQARPDDLPTLGGGSEPLAGSAALGRLGGGHRDEPLPAAAPVADPAAGERAAEVRAVCHTLEESGATTIGPNLWGIVGRPIASVPGYRYSDGLQTLAPEAGVWTEETLAGFLQAPRKWVPDTRMTFAGIRDPQARADLIAFLRTLSHDPTTPE